jgi:glycosyltransferase involved in cell wall biosynthesis
VSEPDVLVSVVIPVYQEAEILRTSLSQLFGDLSAAFGDRFEVILAENGSSDDTVAIATDEISRRSRLSVFSYPEPNYGGALREGIFRARGRYVVCEEIDICDVDFHVRALELLERDEADLVVGSKAMRGADDRRPLVRRAATRAYNGLLRATLGFHGTDTHGLKAFRRDAVVPVAHRCLVEHDVFASELVIRAQRDGVRVVEIPVSIEEKRPPSIDLFRRVPRVAKNVARLALAIHLGRDERGRR